MGKISVIVPVYKVEKYLERCVDSILNQTYTDLEIILVDDGSPDRCGEICDEYSKRDKRIKVIHKENEGVSAARNDGIAAASGEYISFVDSDDYIDNDYIDVLYKNIADCDMVVCNFKLDVADERFRPQHKLFDKEKTITSINEIFSDVFENRIYTYIVWAKLYRTELIKNMAFREDMDYSEDAYFIRDVFTRCNRIKLILYNGYNYYISNHNATSDRARLLNIRIGDVMIIQHTLHICREHCLDVEYSKLEKRFMDILRHIFVIIRTKGDRLTRQEKKFIIDMLKEGISFKGVSLLDKIKTIVRWLEATMMRQIRRMKWEK